MTYAFFGPLLIVYMKQQSMPFSFYPIAGFIASASVFMMYKSNTRYVIAAGLMGAAIWAFSYLLSNLIMRNLKPDSEESGYFKKEDGQLVIRKSPLKEEDVKVTDMLMDRAHIGYYLTLDTVLGPGLSTRRGYTTLGGGPDCGAPPHTIMTYPDFIPQIPCKKITEDSI